MNKLLPIALAVLALCAVAAPRPNAPLKATQECDEYGVYANVVEHWVEGTDHTPNEWMAHVDIEQHPESLYLKLKQCEKSRRPGVKIGDTAKHVREATNWGDPDSVNETITASGRDEQWVYGDGNYLYLHNGKVRSIQRGN